ncbi:serine hydrolase [Ramlibacter sp. AN1015]|uniref:D-alanyl-D-alanine carboxypeptidase family protein n=1 Tax=Ramlibacter sp. AN1015 TaxID=3133428 RepID=UPI0030BFF30F
MLEPAQTAKACVTEKTTLKTEGDPTCMRRFFLSTELSRRQRRQYVLLALCGVLLLAAVAATWLAAGYRDATGSGPAERGSNAATSASPEARHAEAPVDSTSEGEAELAREDAGAVQDGTTQPAAFRPPLLSDDANLSYARRGGLHRAANPLLLTASAVVLADQHTGEVLYARNDRAILPIASLTKLLTGIVVLESKQPLSGTIRIAQEDVDRLRNSRSRLRVGTTLTRREALRLALMSSENRAAHALARTFPGGPEAFVAAMNTKAQALGMRHSTFVDATGLSNGNQATARDVATLVTAAARYPLLRSYSTTSRRVVTVGKTRLRYLNSNRLVRTGWPIQLQKTGYIVEAGQCMAMALRTEGRKLVMVLLDSGSRDTRREDAQRLRRWLARQKG